jgi:hypothetical protein
LPTKPPTDDEPTRSPSSADAAALSSDDRRSLKIFTLREIRGPASRDVRSACRLVVDQRGRALLLLDGEPAMTFDRVEDALCVFRATPSDLVRLHRAALRGD